APESHPKLDQLLHELSGWMATGQLKRDAEPRELVQRLLQKSIRWEDQREIPAEVWREAFGSKDVVDLEGMRTKPRQGRFTIRFERSEEMRNLIEALGQFEYAGAGTWDFPYAERHKRTVARWLRRHRGRILESLKPETLDAS